MSAKIGVVGSFVQDLAFQTPSFPQPGESVIGEFLSGPGGKGSNQAVAAHRQEVPTLFIGCTGDDVLADGYRSWCEQEGLPVRLQVAKGKTSGAASIVVNAQAENAIVVALGANLSLSPEHVLSALEEESDLSVLVFQLESNPEATTAGLQYGKEKGILTILNTAPMSPSITREQLQLADYITPNESECASLLKHFCNKEYGDTFYATSDESLREIFAELPVNGIILTLGSKGSLLYQKEEPVRGIHGAQRGQILRTPAVSVKPVDTTGAGDAFNGGLAAGLVRYEGDLPRAIQFATAVAGLSTERQGTAPAMPSLAEVQRVVGE